jgi:hypothetical protein
LQGIERGFDFLGYFMKPAFLTVSSETFKRFAKRIYQLFEQGVDSVRICKYIQRWFLWLRTGITLETFYSD